jgi:hypothetical protein
MADMDNDGRVDVYACNDVGPSNIWMTDTNGTPDVRRELHGLEPPPLALPGLPVPAMT